MHPQHGEIYWADLSPRFGSEPGKVRPVLVIQSDLLNRVGHPSTWVIPCTSNCVGENVLRVHLQPHVAGNTVDCEVMIDQSRSIDNRRFKRRMGTLPPQLLNEVKSKLKRLAEM